MFDMALSLRLVATKEEEEEEEEEEEGKEEEDEEEEEKEEREEGINAHVHVPHESVIMCCVWQIIILNGYHVIRKYDSTSYV